MAVKNQRNKRAALDVMKNYSEIDYLSVLIRVLELISFRVYFCNSSNLKQGSYVMTLSNEWRKEVLLNSVTG